MRERSLDPQIVERAHDAAERADGPHLHAERSHDEGREHERDRDRARGGGPRADRARALLRSAERILVPILDAMEHLHDLAELALHPAHDLPARRAALLEIRAHREVAVDPRAEAFDLGPLGGGLRESCGLGEVVPHVRERRRAVCAHRRVGGRDQLVGDAVVGEDVALDREDAAVALAVADERVHGRVQRT